MSFSGEAVKAEVISVKPQKITISVKEITDFDQAENSLKVGAFLEILNDDGTSTLAILRSFSIGAIHEDDISNNKHISQTDDKSRSYIIEAFPLGVLENGKFRRGSDALPIPPKGVRIADINNIKSIYNIEDKKVSSFCFSELLQNRNYSLPTKLFQPEPSG